MESIIRNVADIEADDRRSLEHVVGRHLEDNQQVIIQVKTVGHTEPIENSTQPSAGALPDWCNVYEGLSDDEIAEVEAAALDRSSWNRPTK